MTKEQFVKNRPELYHLTAQENLPLILKHRKLYSTNKIIDLTNGQDLIMIKRERRPNHVKIDLNGDIIYIRDQRPISEKVLQKCLTHNWSCPDFYEFLNSRVFTWPTLNRLQSHFDRYKDESPIILVFDTQDVFNFNPSPLFSRLNSGATRANSHLGGKAPERGPETFLKAENYDGTVSSVAEVTFLEEMVLPESFEICYQPNGKREKMSLV